MTLLFQWTTPEGQPSLSDLLLLRLLLLHVCVWVMTVLKSRQLLVTARNALQAACQRERSAGRLRLEANKRQSDEEVLHLEREGRRLRAEVAGLQT